jgi:hypothetical protein
LSPPEWDSAVWVSAVGFGGEGPMLRCQPLLRTETPTHVAAL